MEKAKAAYDPTDGVIPNPQLRLLDQVREVIRVKHYSIRTEDAYVQWIKAGNHRPHGAAFVRDRNAFDGMRPAQSEGLALRGEPNPGARRQRVQGSGYHTA